MQNFFKLNQELIDLVNKTVAVTQVQIDTKKLQRI